MNGSKLLPIALSAQGALLLALLSFGLSQWSAMHARLSATEIALATLSQSATQIHDLILETRREQVSRTQRFAELEKQILLLDNRVHLLSERVLSLSQRLTPAPPAPIP